MANTIHDDVRNLLSLGKAALLACLALPSAHAYNVFPYPLGAETGYLKWGDPHAGKPAGVVTWSLMPNGTALNPDAPDYTHGTSNLTGIFNQVGGENGAIPLIQTAFDAWSQVANIQFAYLGVDDGTPFNAPYAPGQAIGDIRIGGFEFDGFSAGIGFAAPPNGGTTLEGDVILNARSDIAYYNAPGAEGALYDLFPPGGGFYRNDVLGLLTHEIGHALGLAHSEVPSGCMCGYVSPEFDGSPCEYSDPNHDGRAPINRLPDADDVAGIQFLYGPPITADFNGDAAVDGADLLIWQRGNGTAAGATRLDGDANNDAAVNAADLQIWQTDFAPATPIATPIPEPANLALTFLATATLTAASRRSPSPPLAA